jgi:hypothetical protein
MVLPTTFFSGLLSIYSAILDEKCRKIMCKMFYNNSATTTTTTTIKLYCLHQLGVFDVTLQHKLCKQRTLLSHRKPFFFLLLTASEWILKNSITFAYKSWKE